MVLKCVMVALSVGNLYFNDRTKILNRNMRQNHRVRFNLIGSDWAKQDHTYLVPYQKIQQIGSRLQPK